MAGRVKDGEGGTAAGGEQTTFFAEAAGSPDHAGHRQSNGSSLSVALDG